MVKELKRGKEIYLYHPNPSEEGKIYKQKTWAAIRGLDVTIRLVTFEEDWKRAGYYLSLSKDAKN